MSGPTDAALREAGEAFVRLDRRGFLRLVGALGVAGLAPAGCGDAAPPLAPPHGLRLAVLTPRSYAVFQAAALGILGPRAAEIVRSGSVDPAALADAWLARLPSLGAQLHQGLLLLELAPWPLLPKLRPFTALDDAGRDAVLRDLLLAETDWKRALFKGLKSFACLTFYAAAPSRTITRYPGPFGDAQVTIAEAMRYDDRP